MPTGGGGNRIDELFGFKLRSNMKCLECDEEAPSTTEELQRVLICHLGSQTDPVSHIYQGVQLSLKEHIEKNSPSLGRNAQYEKSAAVASLPSYLVVQFARFGFKKANDWAGTSDSKVKLIRNIKFGANFDLYDMATDELKKELSKNRSRVKDQEDKKMEEERKKMLEDGYVAGKTGSSSTAPGEADVEMKDADEVLKEAIATGLSLEQVDTGYYDLVGIVSHKGRTADGGHYVGWTLRQKADKENKDDMWLCYDDETVSERTWKDITGVSMQLQGGVADSQIAYINIYKKVRVAVDIGQKLGDGKDAGAAGSGDAAMPDASA